MKPLHISQYLNQFGQHLTAEPRAPVFRSISDSAARARNPGDRQGFEPVRWPIARGEAGRASIDDQSPAPDIEAHAEDAYERGLRDGDAGARDELAKSRVAELAAESERVEAERVDFHLGEYARLANVIGAGLIEIEERISACVARMLVPLIERRMVDQVIDELGENIRTLRSGASPALIVIRGPERLLHKLRERAAPLGGDVEYVTASGVEISIEAHDTVIESQLKPWADLLAVIDPRG